MSRIESVLALVQIPSESRHEGSLANYVEDQLRSVHSLTVSRIGDNVVARTNGGKSERVILAGHLDTVPGDAAAAHISDGTLHGVGAVDMKASLAVYLEIAREDLPRRHEITYVFYAREEIARAESGLLEIHEADSSLLVGDVAVVGEPTNAIVEAGCQGTLRARVTVRGRRAHTARPFTGRNAIHRLAPLIHRVAEYQPRIVTIDGVDFTEQLQVVGVDGGIAANVVPDVATVVLNFRYAPDRDPEGATAWLIDFLGAILEEGDDFDVLDNAPSAAPAVSTKLVQGLVAATGSEPMAKVGWTDVATFTGFGVPATNFGAGNPLLAHSPDECITAQEVDAYYERLSAWL